MNNVIISKEIFDDFVSNKVYSKVEALIYILFSVNENREIEDGRKLTLKFGWSKGNWFRFLEKLVEKKIVEKIGDKYSVLGHFLGHYTSSLSDSYKDVWGTFWGTEKNDKNEQPLRSEKNDALLQLTSSNTNNCLDVLDTVINYNYEKNKLGHLNTCDTMLYKGSWGTADIKILCNQLQNEENYLKLGHFTDLISDSCKDLWGTFIKTEKKFKRKKQRKKEKKYDTHKVLKTKKEIKEKNKENVLLFNNSDKGISNGLDYLYDLNNSNTINSNNKINNSNTNVNSQKKPKKVFKSIDEQKEFYESEYLRLNGIHDNKDKYRILINFLFGENELHEIFVNTIAIEKQLTYEQFNILLRIAAQSGKKLLDELKTFENSEKYYKDKKSLYLTMRAWISSRWIKK